LRVPDPAATGSDDKKGVPGRPDLRGVPFPRSVAGFQFGWDPDTFSAACRRSGGDAASPDAEHAVCTRTLVDIGLPVQYVFANFCGGALCEVGLFLPPNDRELAIEVVRRFQTKYGAPISGTPLGKCAGDLNESVVRRGWAWGSPETVHAEERRLLGMLRVNYDCAEPTDMALTIWYADEKGSMQRWHQANERESNW
jgi:hypothetical protein